MSRRVAVGLLMQESNSFSPLATTVATFENYFLHRGEAIFGAGFERAHIEIHGFISELRAAGVTPVPLLAAGAFAGGPLTEAAFDALVGEMESRLREALPVDGLLLALHGALVVEGGARRGDAEIIARLRRILPPDVPIGITFDLHGHITPEMLQPNCFHVGYQQYPHIDIYETGQRAARLMVDTLDGKRRPVMALAKCPMVVSAVCARTTDGGLVPVVAAARRAELSGRVLHASLFPVQPWIDVPDLGFAALVCADGDVAVAEQVAAELAQAAWNQRDQFTPELVELDDAIRIGLSSEGLTVVSDAGDAPSGGSAADSTAVLRALLAAGAERGKRLVYLSICDPAVVTVAQRMGVGASIEVDIGHYYSRSDGAPLRISATVQLLSDGRYHMRDQDMEIGMGRTVVLAVGALRLLVRTLPSFEWDVAMYLSQGLDPAAAALIFVKSPGGFRHSFGKWAQRILIADTPGPTCANMKRIPFTRVTRPLYPLDSLPE
ncbi:M81 family metallopeptidase [Peristeroidobacter soli]|jgi:microcystin degradation protein MlrC|uniref:M81 family metallopeptidase n=1 Tax=Peristeroidobacter soli TaxID=2497877 RepID=UPI00101DA1B3|nr:M81 family metallopeptidase [Peristeroidobacter soli]